MNIIKRIKETKIIREYVEGIIFSIGGSVNDAKLIMKTIKENRYTTINEVDSFLENVYI